MKYWKRCSAGQQNVSVMKNKTINRDYNNWDLQRWTQEGLEAIWLKLSKSWLQKKELTWQWNIVPVLNVRYRSCLLGHNLKLRKKRSRLNCRKFFSSQRVVNEWNALPSQQLQQHSQCCWRTQALLSLYVRIVDKTLILILIIFSIKLRSLSGTGQVDSVIVLYVLEHPKFIESCLK